jgi:hypothetical protein
MHRHVPSRLTRLKDEALPSRRVVLSRRSAVLWPPPTSHPASLRISLLSLYRQLRSLWTNDQMRSLLFHRLLSQHPTLPTPEGSSRLHSRIFTASVAFACVQELGSLFSPFGPPFRCYKLHIMLRAALLRPIHWGIRRFSTSGCLDALDACYMAASGCQNRPDSAAPLQRHAIRIGMLPKVGSLERRARRILAYPRCETGTLAGLSVWASRRRL